MFIDSFIGLAEGMSDIKSINQKLILACYPWDHRRKIASIFFFKFFFFKKMFSKLHFKNNQLKSNFSKVWWYFEHNTFSNAVT
jgi:hypothetical protein